MPEFILAFVVVFLGWRLWRLYRAHKEHQAWLRNMRKMQVEFQEAKERHRALRKDRRKLFKREGSRG